MATRSSRDWTQARAKVEDEARCRACGWGEQLQAAHIIPRSRINAGDGAEDPRNIVPLCIECHARQHRGELELLALLRRNEQSYIVELVGLGEAYRRVTA